MDTNALIVYNIVRTNAALSPFIDAALRELHLTGAQMNALLVLRDAGNEGLPLSEIGRRLVVTKANVTGLMDRLERQELIRRDSDAPDLTATARPKNTVLSTKPIVTAGSKIRPTVRV